MPPIISPKQKGCHMEIRGTGDLQYIDQRKYVAMAWIDYKMAYDVVPQTSIVDCTKILNISDKVIKFITEAMKNRKVELTTGKNFSKGQNQERRLPG